MEERFLDFSVRKLRQLMGRIRTCVENLDDNQLWARAGEEQNAAGNLLLHLAGNVRQWIGSGVAGLANHRVRDREFSAREGGSGKELLEALQTAVEQAAGILEKLPPERLGDHIRVQGYDVTVLEAVYHVVEHFSQHTGQIILLTRMHTGRGTNFYGHLRGVAAHGEKTP